MFKAFEKTHNEYFYVKKKAGNKLVTMATSFGKSHGLVVLGNHISAH